MFTRSQESRNFIERLVKQALDSNCNIIEFCSLLRIAEKQHRLYGFLDSFELGCLDRDSGNLLNYKLVVVDAARAWGRAPNDIDEVVVP